MHPLPKATILVAFGCVAVARAFGQTLLVGDSLTGDIYSVSGSGTYSTVVTGLGQPEQLSLGPAGAFLVADYRDGQIDLVGSTGGAVSSYSSAVNYVSAVAYDPSNGDVYVGVAGDAHGGSVYAISSGGTVTTLATDVGHINALTSNGAGILYGASSSEVFSLSEASGALSDIGTYGTDTDGIATFGGSLFVANSGSSIGVYQLSLAGSVEASWAIGSTNSVAVDTLGNLFGTQAATGTVFEIRAGGVYSTLATLPVPGTSIDGIAVVTTVPEPAACAAVAGLCALALAPALRRAAKGPVTAQR